MVPSKKSCQQQPDARNGATRRDQKAEKIGSGGVPYQRTVGTIQTGRTYGGNPGSPMHKSLSNYPDWTNKDLVVYVGRVQRLVPIVSGGLLSDPKQRSIYCMKADWFLTGV